MIELLAFQPNNIQLCLSRRHGSCLTHFGSIFPFMPPENIKNLWLSDVSKGYKKLILLFWKLLTGKIRRYIYLSIKPIYLRFGILNSVFQHWIGISHSLIPFFRDKLVGEGRGRGNVPVYSCERLGLYIILLGRLWSVRWFKSMFCFLWFYAKVKNVHK